MKITTCLILTILLATSLGSAFGFVYCDQGCLSDIHHKNHHVDESHEALGEDFAISFDQQLSDSDDSCVDFPLLLSNGIIEEDKIVKCPAHAAQFLPAEKLTIPVNLCLYSYNYSPEYFPRISQTILAHRTVVLLR